MRDAELINRNLTNYMDNKLIIFNTGAETPPVIMMFYCYLTGLSRYHLWFARHIYVASTCTKHGKIKFGHLTDILN